jgi:hypothetical protein
LRFGRVGELDISVLVWSACLTTSVVLSTCRSWQANGVSAPLLGSLTGIALPEDHVRALAETPAFKRTCDERKKVEMAFVDAAFIGVD